MKVNIQLFGSRGATSSLNVSPKEKYIQLIVDTINKDYSEIDDEYKEDVDSWGKFLNETGRDSKDFKEDILWLARENDNQNFRWGKTNAFNYNLNDDGDIQLEDGSLYSYRKAIAEARKKIKWLRKNDDED